MQSLLRILIITLLPAVCLAQAVVAPLNIVGLLEGSAADNPTLYNTGGYIKVNGLRITIPLNLQFQFPAAFIPFKDVAGRFTGYEVSVVGNYVNDVAIAGLVQISQQLGNINSGVIKSLATDGLITLTSGQTLRINDPRAVYSAGYTLDPEFTADDENPSITAFSGFPMCVPRSAADPKCPLSNRPVGQGTFTAPDPLVMAPLMPGDYIEFSGIERGSTIICYSLVASNVQILTTGVPAYIRVEDAIIGVYDGNTASEFGDTRFIGYTTDSSVSFLISRSEINPCTGAVSYTTVGSAAPKVGDARNKWTWRADSTTLSRYTRDYHITVSSGTKLTNGGQILAGQYVQPVGEWIFPESLTPGILPPTNSFTQFTHLTGGLGPDSSGNIFGPLSPWPDFPAPAAPACPVGVPVSPPPPPPPTPVQPVAIAGTSQTLRPGIVCALDGKVDNSAQFTAGDLTYTWSHRTSGTPINLAGASSLKPSFTLPPVAAVTTYTFDLTVTSANCSCSSTSSVLVTNDPNGNDHVALDSYTHTTQNGGTISVTCHTDVVDGTATMSLFLLNPTAGSELKMTSQGGGKFSYNARSTKKPSGGVRCVSNFRGFANSVSTTAKKRKRRGEASLA